MEIEFFGANCFRLKSKKTTIVVDDNLNSLNGKTITNDKATAVFSSESLRDKITVDSARLVIDCAGEYEVGDITVNGIQTRAHMDTDEQETATVFQFLYGGQTVTLLGHVHPELSDEVLELISGTDVLLVPVGGNGYTLDPIGAVAVIKKVEPGVVIPSQFNDKDLNFEVPAQPLEEFTKIGSFGTFEEMDSFKLLNSADELSSTQTKIIILNKQ